MNKKIGYFLLAGAVSVSLCSCEQNKEQTTSQSYVSESTNLTGTTVHTSEVITTELTTEAETTTQDRTSSEEYTTADVQLADSKWYDLAGMIYEAGYAYTVEDTDDFTQEEYDFFWTLLEEGWQANIKLLVDYLQKYDEYALQYIGFSQEEVRKSKDLQLVFVMVFCNYGEVTNGVLNITEPEGGYPFLTDGHEYRLSKGEYPSLNVMTKLAMAKANYDAEKYYQEESIGTAPDFLDEAKKQFVRWKMDI